MKIKKTKFDVPFRTTAYSYELDKENDGKNQLAWKLGDWCICEMEIKQITAIDKKTLLPTEVSCGCFCVGYRDWTPRLFPLTLRNKNIAEHFHKVYSELHDTTVNLNYPDIYRYFCNACDECIKSDKEKTELFIREISNFKNAILESVKKTQKEEINGVYIFK